MYTAKCSLSRPGPLAQEAPPVAGRRLGLRPGPALRTPRWAVGPLLGGALLGGLQPGASPDKRLASKRPGALGLTSVAWPPWAARVGARRCGYGRLWGAVPSQDPRWRRDSVGFLGSWGDGADVPAQALGCVWPGRGSGRSTWCPIKPGSSSASRKDRKRHGRQRLPSLRHTLPPGPVGTDTPSLSSSADRVGYGLPGWVPRALDTLGAT